MVTKINIHYERFLLSQISQKSGETYNDFRTRLELQLAKCEYGTMADEILIDRVIAGINDDTARLKLLEEDKLDINKVHQISKSTEACKQ